MALAQIYQNYKLLKYKKVHFDGRLKPYPTIFYHLKPLE